METFFFRNRSNCKSLVKCLTISLTIFFAHFFIATNSHAEYRVFTLKIQSGETVKIENSTLDPDQYPAYFPVPANAIITYTDTWKCPGRTDGQPLCPNPKLPPPTTEAVTAETATPTQATDEPPAPAPQKP